MSVIIYKAKNYKVRGLPMELVHKIYPNGDIITITRDEDFYSQTKTTKNNGNIYEKVYWEEPGMSRKYYYKNNELHRDDDKPALIRYENNFSTVIREWYKEGLLHRDHGPARMRDYEEECIYIRHYYKNGEKVK